MSRGGKRGFTNITHKKYSEQEKLVSLRHISFVALKVLYLLKSWSFWTMATCSDVVGCDISCTLLFFNAPTHTLQAFQ